MNSIKLYFYAILAGITLLIVGWVKSLSSKNKELKSEVVILKQNEIVKDEVRVIEKSITKAKEQVKKESEVVHEQNKKDNVSRTKPTGSFNDKRL